MQNVFGYFWGASAVAVEAEPEQNIGQQMINALDLRIQSAKERAQESLKSEPDFFQAMNVLTRFQLPQGVKHIPLTDAITQLTRRVLTSINKSNRNGNDLYQPLLDNPWANVSKMLNSIESAAKSEVILEDETVKNALEAAFVQREVYEFVAEQLPKGAVLKSSSLVKCNISEIENPEALERFLTLINDVNMAIVSACAKNPSIEKSLIHKFSILCMTKESQIAARTFNDIVEQHGGCYREVQNGKYKNARVIMFTASPITHQFG